MNSLERENRGSGEERQEELIEEKEFQSILSVAERALDVYGLNEASDPPRVTHTEGELKISNKCGVIDIFFRGSLVFRHDPTGGITDFFDTDGIWIDELQRIGLNIPPTSSGIASRRK